LDGLLHRAVQTSLEGRSSPAVFLSGGIDSGLLAALGSRIRPDIVAVTVGFGDQGYDEAPLAARIASHLGIRHEVLKFSHGEYLSAFERLSRTLEQPMADPATPATVLAFDHCRERFDVVLDGTGADEALGAMPPRHVRLAVQYGSLVPRPTRAALVRAMRAIPGLADYTPLLDFEHPADTMMRWRGFTRPEIEELCGEPVSFEHTQYYRTFARFPRQAHFERYGALLDAMPSDRLSEAMRATGLRVRFPFFDRSANHFIRQLPGEFRFLPGQPKRILRALLARYVPRDIWDAPKHGFDFPLYQFLQAEDHALVHRYLLSGLWLDLGVLKADVVRRYAHRFIAGDQGMTFRVWALVVLGAWLERHPMQRSG
jgi:asparagine synthase (glutamine-hydrolysing)